MSNLNTSSDHETVPTFEVQLIRTAVAGMEQQVNQIEWHSLVSLRAGFSFAVRKGALVSRTVCGWERNSIDRTGITEAG